jgi:2-polyprenyl-6-methoxyphenol hydroxylase-like FAD-dependent oxidoreductase
MSNSNFKVIIVGGGISGLTLANALERADVDYVVLEGRGEIAPCVGASIAISANGGRILDQLGCYETILKRTVPIDYIQTWRDGRMIDKADSPLLNHIR